MQQWFLRFSRFEWFLLKIPFVYDGHRPIRFQFAKCQNIGARAPFEPYLTKKFKRWKKKRPFKLETVCLNYAMPEAVIQRHYFALKLDPNLFSRVVSVCVDFFFVSHFVAHKFTVGTLGVRESVHAFHIDLYFTQSGKHFE